MPPQNRRWRFHGLKKPKIRQDWNKYNFYNLSRLRSIPTASRTYFQQKWSAKAATRAYHGEQVKEKHWQRMFSRVAPAVVPMNPQDLASSDGAEHAAGRGSGKEVAPGEKKYPPMRTPYMQMVFHPMERRLDTAVFRALFASSARQARQAVVHGHVKVNGKKMIYPGYLLNPGDMFQVDPTTVLTCTGKFVQPQKRGKDIPLAATKASTPAPEPEPEPEEEAAEEAEEDLDEDPTLEPTDPSLATKKSLLALRSRAATLLASPPKGRKLSARQKQDLRAFRTKLKSTISRPASVSPSALDDLEAEYEVLESRATSAGANETPTSSEESVAADRADPKPGPSSPPSPGSTGGPDASSLGDGDAAPARQLGPTWKPKDYMSAFAFIPRYLEVNQSICSAVYLRHPVCKPGFAEVPTPFHFETGQLTFNWYLRRR